VKDYKNWFTPNIPKPPKIKQLTQEQYEEVLPLAIQFFKFVFIDSIKKDYPHVSVYDLEISGFDYQGANKGLWIRYRNQKALEFYFGLDGNWYKVTYNPNPVTEKVYDAQLSRLLKPILDEYFNNATTLL